MKARTAALLIGVALAFYLVLVGWRGVEFIRAGGVVPVLMGIAILGLPVIGGWALWREWRFGEATQRLAGELAEAGRLPEDDLPRRPSGRVVREAADARFEERRIEVEADPESWQAWFRLAVAYDDAGDRKRARESMRRAISLHR